MLPSGMTGVKSRKVSNGRLPYVAGTMVCEDELIRRV